MLSSGSRRFLSVIVFLVVLQEVLPLPLSVTSSTEAASGERGAQAEWGRAAGLDYLEVLPEGVDPNEALPLVVVIHGMGDAPRLQYAAHAATELRARFVLPRAPAPYKDGFSWFPHRIASGHPELERAIPGRADQLASLVRTLRQKRPTRGRVVVTGFSQGGILSYAMALFHPELVELAHPIAGYLPEPLWPLVAARATHYPPIRAMHGTEDAVVPYAPTRTMAGILRRRGFDVSLQPVAGVAHTRTPAMREATARILAEGVHRARLTPSAHGRRQPVLPLPFSER